MSDNKVAATFHPSKAHPTPQEYRLELEAELKGLEDGRQSQYTERRIRTLKDRLTHLYNPEEETDS